jgi:hypothetical protein
MTEQFAMISTEEKKSVFFTFPQYLLTALAAVGTVLILGWVLKYSAYGIDFTDESFYLIWISNPFIYDASLTQFGFVYHPLYSLLGGDIAALRQANILITFGLAWSLTYSCLAFLVPSIKESRITRLVVAAGLATSATNGLIIAGFWLSTPSYNSLALQALLIAAIGLVLAERAIHSTSIIGWVLIGIGGWLAFMAKPSTALALAIGVFVYLLLSRKLSVRMLALSVVCALALVLASALLIDGSVLRFVDRIVTSIELATSMGGGHTLKNSLRIDEFQLDKQTKTALWLVFGLVAISLCCLWAENTKWLFVGIPISIGFFSITAMMSLGAIHQNAGFGQFQSLMIFGLVFASIFAVTVIGRTHALKSVTTSRWALACMFLALPHVYAFGTTNNYWQSAGSAAIFWLLAGVIVLSPLVRQRRSWMLLLPLAIAGQAVTATLLQTGLEQPYRQPQPLRLNTSTLELGPQKSALVLSDSYAEYISGATSAAKAAAFEPTTPVIDLTGHSPGLLYALGAESLGQAWIIGGYPGSSRFAQAALARATCEKIASAWILLEPEGPRSISTQLLSSLGADFPGSYNIAGFWFTAKGSGGYSTSRRQEFYKPILPLETLASCQKLRTTNGK